MGIKYQYGGLIMKYICQLGNGFMLVKKEGTYERESTGYPYPDVDDGQIQQLGGLFGTREEIGSKFSRYITYLKELFACKPSYSFSELQDACDEFRRQFKNGTDKYTGADWVSRGIEEEQVQNAQKSAFTMKSYTSAFDLLEEKGLTNTFLDYCIDVGLGQRGAQLQIALNKGRTSIGRDIVRSSIKKVLSDREKSAFSNEAINEMAFAYSGESGIVMSDVELFDKVLVYLIK